MRHKLVLTLLAMCLTRLLAQSTGSIAGIVVGADTNTPLSGASVLIVGHQATGAPVFFETTTGKDGAYLISNVPAGDYAVCARYKAPVTGGSRKDFWQARVFVEEEIAYLDTCDWSQTQPKSTVSAGRVNVNIRLQRGANVLVLVDDPANLLDTAASSGASLQISVLDASGNVRAALPMLYNIGGLRRYGATLPTGNSYSLEVRTQGASLVPSTGGSTYPSDFRLPVQTANRSLLVAHFKLQK